MKTSIWIGVLLMGVISSTSAALFNYTGPAYAIPDGNINGAFSAISVSGSGLSLTDIKVTLDVSGGFNGDLYAYLSYGGNLVPLLNRVGVGTINGGTAFGSTGSGFTVTLASTGTDIHWTSGTLTGNYLADGRAIDPLSGAVNFNADGARNLDGTFGGVNPNGTWTLFFADVSGGGGTATLNGWSLDVTAVPEPAAWGIISAAGLLVISGLHNWRSVRKRQREATTTLKLGHPSNTLSHYSPPHCWRR